MNMNNALGSPLEALAFNYLSLGFLTVVNNLWTWVAVVTAAVSVWKIRAAGTASTKSPRNPDVLPPPAAEEEAAADQPPPASEMRIAPVFRAAETTEATTSGKFTVYYEDDGERELPSSTEATVDGGFGVAAVKEDEWCEELKRSLRVRMGDMGWYRYQDLTAFDGNVVRLWDGCCSL